MKERPILFSGEMVRAILDGRKTQTRRVCKLRGFHQIDFIGGKGDWNDPTCWGFEDGDGYHWALKGDELAQEIPCPYGQPGDQLWVRETFRFGSSDDCTCYESCNCIVGKPLYKATHDDGEKGWKPSIYMPRRASRIQLEVTNVRVERLQDITNADVYAEGIRSSLREYDACVDAADKFVDLWDSINADEHPWESNPWVWCISFRRI